MSEAIYGMTPDDKTRASLPIDVVREMAEQQSRGEGAEAAKAGRGLESNPYADTPGTRMRRLAWQEGWGAANGIPGGWDALREAIVVPDNIHPALVARFKDGFCARMGGQERNTNPFSLDGEPIKAGAWDLGWLEARNHGTATVRKMEGATVIERHGVVTRAGVRFYATKDEAVAYEAGLRHARTPDGSNADNPYMPNGKTPGSQACAMAWAQGHNDGKDYEAARRPTPLPFAPDVRAYRKAARLASVPDVHRKLIPVPGDVQPEFTDEYLDGYVAGLVGHGAGDNLYDDAGDGRRRAWEYGLNRGRDALKHSEAAARGTPVGAATPGGVVCAVGPEFGKSGYDQPKTYDRPDVRAAVRVPDGYDAGRSDAFRDGAIARLDGVEKESCPYPKGTKIDPMREAWLDAWRGALFGVRRIASGDHVGKFTFANEWDATHVIRVSGLRAVLAAQSGLIIAVEKTGAGHVEFGNLDPAAYGPSVLERVSIPQAVVSPGSPLPPLQPDPKAPPTDNERGVREFPAKVNAAFRTLESRGFTYRGGEAWVPPSGKWSPGLRSVAIAARDALGVIARLGRLPSEGEATGNWAHVQQLVGDLTRALDADAPPPQGGHSSAAFLAAVKAMEDAGFVFKDGKWVSTPENDRAVCQRADEDERRADVVYNRAVSAAAVLDALKFEYTGDADVGVWKMPPGWTPSRGAPQSYGEFIDNERRREAERVLSRLGYVYGADPTLNPPTWTRNRPATPPGYVVSIVDDVNDTRLTIDIGPHPKAFRLSIGGCNFAYDGADADGDAGVCAALNELFYAIDEASKR